MWPRLRLPTSCLLVLAVLAGLAACATAPSPEPPPRPAADPLDGVADDYVRLVLAAGRHDENIVDAYYGPPEWKQEASAGAPRPIPDLVEATRALLARTREAPASARRDFLDKQLVALEATLRRAGGATFPLAEEARLLFDTAPPACGPEILEPALARVAALLPGDAPLAERMAEARRAVEIPRDRLPAVVDAVLAETRRRTAAFVPLPEGERFRVEYVTGKPWGAYNWYQGGYQSLIQVNTDLPATLDGVLDTVAHEGYPGHHVYNALLEHDLVRGKGWREYTVYPLYSPQSLIAEGTADAGSRVILDEAARREVLATLAGIAGVPPQNVARWLELRRAARPLGCIMSEAARQLLDERRPDGEVEAFLVRYGTSPERARQNLRFIRAYRSYTFTYTAGERLVERHIGDGADRAARFFDLLRRPVVPSGL